MRTASVPQKSPSAAAEEISRKVADDTVPLIQMSGSSKKRKRKELEEDEPDYHPIYNLPENDLHTPVPNIKKKCRWRTKGKKREFSDGDNEQEFKKRRVDGYSNQQQQQQKQQQNKQQQKRFKNKKNKGKGNQQQQQQQQQGSSQNWNQRNTQQWSNNKKNRGQQRQQQLQPFDYSSVDYSQFGGGGKSVAGVQKPNNKFKNKVRRFCGMVSRV